LLSLHHLVERFHQKLLVSPEVGQEVLLAQTVHEPAEHCVKELPPLRRIEPDPRIDPNLVRDSDAEDVSEEVLHRTGTRHLQRTCGQDRAVRLRGVQIQARLGNMAVILGEPVAGSRLPCDESPPQVGKAADEHFLRVQDSIPFAHPPNPGLGQVETAVEAARGEGGGLRKPTDQVILIALGISSEDPEGGQHHGAREHLPIIGEAPAAVAQRHVAPEPCQEPCEALCCSGEAARCGGQIPGHPDSLSIEKKRVLQARAREAAVVQPDDKGVLPAGVTAAVDRGHMKPPGPRPFSAHRSGQTQILQPLPDVQPLHVLISEAIGKLSDPFGEPNTNVFVEAVDVASVPLQEGAGRLQEIPLPDRPFGHVRKKAPDKAPNRLEPLDSPSQACRLVARSFALLVAQPARCLLPLGGVHRLIDLRQVPCPPAADR